MIISDYGSIFGLVCCCLYLIQISFFLEFFNLKGKEQKSNFINKLSKTCKLFVLMDCCHSGSNLDLPYRLLDKTVTQVSSLVENSANVIKISGCRDDQTSTDFYDYSEKEYQGALTCAFLDSNSGNRFLKRYNKIINNLKSNGFKQRPVLSFTRPDIVNWYLYDERFELNI